MGVLKTKPDRIEIGKGGRAVLFSYAHVVGAASEEPENAPTLSAVYNTIATAPDHVAVRLPPILDAGQVVWVLNHVNSWTCHVYATPPDTFPNEPDYIEVDAAAVRGFVAINPGGQKLWLPI